MCGPVAECTIAYNPGSNPECNNCHGFGYRGRTVIPEVWVIGAQEQQMIYEGVNKHESYRKVAIESGMKPMVVTGMELVYNGNTNIDELRRTTATIADFKANKELIRNIVSR